MLFMASFKNRKTCFYIKMAENGRKKEKKKAKKQAGEAETGRNKVGSEAKKFWQYQWLKESRSPAATLMGCSPACKNYLLLSPVKFHNGLAKSLSIYIFM